jgi:flagellum-specific ATP synthase
MDHYLSAIREASLVQRLGHVVRLSGLLVESVGPDCAVGQVCLLRAASGKTVKAEVVALREGRVVLMPYGDIAGIGLDCEVVATPLASEIVPVGPELLGRVIDAFGEPLDGQQRPATRRLAALQGQPINPLERAPIEQVLETGVRAIDAMLTLGRGQRIGIFAGSGVGKSTLLGMVSRQVQADVNVIALIGERGREVKEFIAKNLGHEGLKKSVVVAATSEQPAAARIRAAHAATAIAEHFRAAGLDVLLVMDSVTRLAMARREVGLAVGEPATARGYTPSVFAELPRLVERCGTSASGGSITALYTVLVDGDDMNDPVADAMRSLLDGHVVLSRQLANQGHYPAIDVLQSVSRLLPDLASEAELQSVRGAVSALAAYEKNREMIDMGMYRAGTSPAIDRATRLAPQITQLLRQEVGASFRRTETMKALAALVGAHA